ncbi:hypothetical protein QIS99_07600 [Streptomyces sp. B-S-A8]|uniref:Secreted protein n=1 Tax=Streptomyces solicavernae TaxID=3043614 RepID=A0ABT6RNT8_9ACTN|nr:hypothetical protein [Streptomyces sp. B-S-A8]MDI3386083.1 hypothetical protein [Streptomyces sp. B-S-A8]
MTVEDAEAARRALAEALTEAGITLPSLRVDPLAYVGEPAVPLVELGRCNIPTARALTAALRRGVSPRPAPRSPGPAAAPRG